MKNLLYFLAVILLASCGATVYEEDIVGCWTVEYIDADGVKMKSGKYSICINEDGTMKQQREDGKEEINCEWTLEGSDSLLILHYDDRMPDSMKILKAGGRELHLQKRIKYSKVTLYLRQKK
jgi:hypothetical protein